MNLLSTGNQTITFVLQYFCNLDSVKYLALPIKQVYKTGLLIFRVVADPRNSGISAKSREIPQKTRNTAKSARNISKYISAKHI